MTGDLDTSHSHEGSGDKTQAFNKLLRDTLSEKGLQEALTIARCEAKALGIDALDLMRVSLDLMRVAIEPLFDSEDTDEQSLGFKVLAWEASNFPNRRVALTIFEYAKVYFAEPQQDELMGKCFEIALMHFRSLIKEKGKLKRGAYLDLKEVLCCMGRGYDHLYTSAITEFALPIIELVESYSRKLKIKGEVTDAPPYWINEALFDIIVVLGESDPETAARAKGLITTDSWRESVARLEANRELTSAMLASNFSKAEEILAKVHIIDGLWESMIEQFKKPEGTYEWGNAVMDTILRAKQDYFSRLAEEGSVDLFLGYDFCKVIGLLDRRDILDMLFVPGQEYVALLVIAITFAHGLGLGGNEEGLTYLLTKFDFTDGDRQAIIDTFKNAQYHRFLRPSRI
ncbi:hypothetical protein KA531_00025 [Candidatus Saccharibacteria bacterium]|nr:hypothetical protein [Candidatus Saccharibacteria bacterium]